MAALPDICTLSMTAEISRLWLSTSASVPDLVHSVHESNAEEVGHVACCHGIAIGCPGVYGCTQKLPC